MYAEIVIIITTLTKSAVQNSTAGSCRNDSASPGCPFPGLFGDRRVVLSSQIGDNCSFSQCLAEQTCPAVCSQAPGSPTCSGFGETLLLRGASATAASGSRAAKIAALVPSGGRTGFFGEEQVSGRIRAWRCWYGCAAAKHPGGCTGSPPGVPTKALVPVSPPRSREGHGWAGPCCGGQSFGTGRRLCRAGTGCRGDRGDPCPLIYRPLGASSLPSSLCEKIHTL